MKSMKILGLSLLVVYVLGALAAANASAEAGFLTGGTGTPTTATILGGESKLETSSGGSLNCKQLEDSTITFSNDRTAATTLHLSGCTLGGFAARSAGDETGIILLAISFLVCLDPKNSGGTLLDNFGIAAEIVGTATLEVPSISAKLQVKGIFLGAVLTTGSAKLFDVEFLGAKGEQTVKECLQGASKILHSLLSDTNGGAFELASVNIAGGLIQFAANTELMDS